MGRMAMMGVSPDGILLLGLVVGLIAGGVIAMLLLLANRKK